ncbi:MAG: alpha-mannosidase [Alistipes sp.]|nr:alpha-mannosidase [Candidatus Alistipes equi]
MRKLILLMIFAVIFAAHTNLFAQDRKEKPTVYMVSNAHFDTQWRWTVQTSINEYLHNTLVQNFALFEQYPDYVFNFEGAVKYRWAKEYYPELYKKLKGYIKAGRWHISGASWDANDPNMPSIESSIRNILLGQEFYRKEFGILSTDIMLPDCFGFGWQLPSVAAHCGLIGFSTQKLKWRQNPFFDNGMKFPFYFGVWRGIDGSRVMAALDGGNYTWSPKEAITANEDLRNRIAHTVVPAAYRYFGTGDRGGSATPLAMRNINDAVQNPGKEYNVKFATTDDMFKDFLWDKRLPEYDGELLMDVHATGNYTSKVEMKMLNRRNERLLGAAEGISTMSDYFKGIAYPSYTIDEGWKRILWHQFHDDLTGTSLPECYLFSYNDQYINLRQMNSVIESGMESMSSILNTYVKGDALVVYNSVTSSNSEIVTAKIQLPVQYGGVAVYGPDGKQVKSQIVSREGEQAIVIFAAKDPSLSLSVYDIRPLKKASSKKSALKVTKNTIENRIYRVTLNENGDISSIWDKRYGREMVRSNEAFGYALLTNNKSERYPAWEIMKEVIDRKPEAIASPARITVEQCGTLRAVLKVEREYAGSKFVQRIVLTDGAEDERIDVVNTVDWQTRASLLKASFPVSFEAKEATYDLGMGHIKRGTNTKTAYEVVAQQWADITADDNSYGVTILNDGRYGWDKPNDHTLRLTLFHTPKTAKRYKEQDTQDLGEHTFTYSIIGHKGVVDAVATDIAADKLNQPKMASLVNKHEGRLGRTFSLASSTNPALRIKAFKKAQDGDGYIVRVYELSGKGAKGEILFPMEIVSCREDNGIEDKLQDASFHGRSLNVESSKFALKTFRVRFAEPSIKIVNPTYEKLNLPYNIVAITSDNFTSQGQIGRDKESFAAEILPENFEYRGIPFSFAEADFNDAVSCKKQKITLPEGTKKLHLLVASAGYRPSKEDKRAKIKGGKVDLSIPVKVRFGVENSTFDCSVAYYTGFYGVYGWPGYYESVLRNDDVAYVGSHTHSLSERNKAYVFSYMYLISIPVNGAREIELPDAKNVLIFSATAQK